MTNTKWVKALEFEIIKNKEFFKTLLNNQKGLQYSLPDPPHEAHHDLHGFLTPAIMVDIFHK